jgi:cobalt-zinc-cadmium efflux system protein
MWQPVGREQASAATSPRHAAQTRLRLAFTLTVGILLVEAVGGALAHSLALISDAAHVLTDVIALGLAWFAAAQATRPADERRTFGYHRVGILTALFNGVTLVVIAGLIGYEAYQRLAHPQPVMPWIMLVAAAIGIGINLYIAANLHGHQHHDLNMRAAALHVAGDIGASLGVIVGALAIVVTGATWVDPLVSVLIALFIAIGALRLIAETVNILLESAPRGLAMPELVAALRAIPGVRDVHDLHVWTISSGMRALSCHVVISDIPPSESAPILDALTAMLRERYRIIHTTIQFESTAHSSHEGFCACPPECESALYCELRAADHEHSHEHGHEAPPGDQRRDPAGSRMA